MPPSQSRPSDVRDTELQLDKGLAGGAFATEQRRLVYRDAIGHRPRPRWRGGAVPRLHVDEGQRADRRRIVSLIFLARRADDAWDGVKSRLPAHRIVRRRRGRHDRAQQLDRGAVVHPAADQTRRQRNQRRMIARPGDDAVDQRVPVAAVAGAGRCHWISLPAPAVPPPAISPALPRARSRRRR